LKTRFAFQNASVSATLAGTIAHSQLPDAPPKAIDEQLQGFLWNLESFTSGPVFRMAAALIGFGFLAVVFVVRSHGFSNQEAMESAQLGRHLAAWKGYTTYSIRPLTLHLLQEAKPENAAEVLHHPVPDLSIAPGYPFVLACLMKVLPFNFAANRGQLWPYQPELMIVGLNELLFFLSAIVLFQLARRLFDSSVAWVSAIAFGGSEIYWKFSLSGLSTMWLLLIFLSVVWCLVTLDERDHREAPPSPAGSVWWAVVAGVLVGIGSLSIYAFVGLIIPVLVYMWVFLTKQRGKLCFLTSISFLIIITPWIARNYALSHTPFGTAGFAFVQNTRTAEEDHLERSFDPTSEGLGALRVRSLLNKFLSNMGKILRDDLPRLGSNWAWAFFLCGLLLPFRLQPLQHLRFFVVGTMVLLCVVQAFGQTHLSTDSPDINSENLLVLIAPLVLVFGTGFFFTLLHQMEIPNPTVATLAGGLFAAVLCAPLFLSLVTAPDLATFSPYNPVRIQTTAFMMKPDELMMSDVPWAVAWYGERPCSWLTTDDGDSFEVMNKLKPVQAIYFTERTTERPFLSEMVQSEHSWGHFFLACLPKSEAPQGAVPPGFPLKKAPPKYVPAQLFIADTVRWKVEAKP
jgi:hypothetical protein